jgi:TolB-like protein/DNA-binding winged helix-turn-helix (wHTH) protein/tetratricopeptide (TPR) repeat protein
MPQQPSVFRFGSYESRVRTKELYKHGVRLKVRPQPLQVLNTLLSRAGDVVTREELRLQLWSAETFVDFENGLNTSIKELRAVLGDSAAEPRYIETLPKLGYRFIAEVETGTAAVAIAVPAPATSAPEAEGRLPESPVATNALQPNAEMGAGTSTGRPRSRIFGFAALVLLGVLGYGYWRSHLHARSGPPAGKIMIAVLPFANLTGDATQEYFSDGLTDEMIAQLERLDPGHVGVIARTSVMHYKNTEESLPQIGSELGVDYVIEGSVRKDPEQVRINASLIRVNDQSPLWSRQYNRTLSDLTALQDEIAQEAGDGILSALGESKLASAVADVKAPRRATTTYAVYDLYLSGRFFWNKRTVDGFEQAAGYFQQAIEKDPNYAPAYAGLADTYALRSSYAVVPDPRYALMARAAAAKAVELDDSLAEAHTSLALVAQNYDYDWQTAEREYKRAIELDPGYATAHHWYAECLAFQGRFDESFEEYERARQLDPLSLVIGTDFAIALYYSRQYSRSIAQFEHVKAMDPYFPRAHNVVWPYLQLGQYDKAIAELDSWENSTPNQWEIATRAYVLASAGRNADARASLRKLEDTSKHGSIDPLQMAVATMLLDRDASFGWLRQAYEKHSPALPCLKVEPFYDPLRGDPRFQKYLRLLKLSE